METLHPSLLMSVGKTCHPLVIMSSTRCPQLAVYISLANTFVACCKCFVSKQLLFKERQVSLL